MIRVMIVKELGLLRGALCAVLQQESDMEVVAEAAEPAEVLGLAVTRRPDVLVTELDLNGFDLVPLLHRVAEDVPDCAVLVLSRDRTPAALHRALQARVRGFLGDGVAPADLVRQIRAVAAGERVIDAATALAALRATTNPLTEREREILRAVASGATAREVAQRFYLASGTVRNHLAAAVRKTGARNRVEAVRVATEADWL